MPPFTVFQQSCIALLSASPPTHARHCLRSALYHLERAEAICEIDPAMAVFRSITAEEEAASGVMRCLQELSYPNAEALNPHDHVHKHAVFPFMQILELFIGQTLSSHFKRITLHIQQTGEARRLTLAMNLTVAGVAQLAYPIPPLNFSLLNPDTGESPDYTHQINQLVAAKGKATIKTFLKAEANVRNQVLYADPTGYPTIPSLDPGFLEERRKRVLAMMNIYLLVSPYSEHQPFVSQAIASFVNLVKQLRRSRGVA
jgi:hypothetical protein